jgi:hypothetical protein
LQRRSTPRGVAVEPPRRDPERHCGPRFRWGNDTWPGGQRHVGGGPTTPGVGRAARRRLQHRPRAAGARNPARRGGGAAPNYDRVRC